MGNLTINGKTQSLRDHCRDAGVNYNTIKTRIRSGMSPRQALKTGNRTRADAARANSKKSNWGRY